MNMPPKIDTSFFAPCGMNCLVCYKHCFAKNPCPGCLAGEAGKPEHCRRCKTRECAEAKGLDYCFACGEFPCKQIRNLDRSYQKRYDASLVQNSLFAKEQGLAAFMARQKEQYTCPACGGVISLHDGVCSECCGVAEWSAIGR